LLVWCVYHLVSGFHGSLVGASGAWWVAGLPGGAVPVKGVVVACGVAETANKDCVVAGGFLGATRCIALVVGVEVLSCTVWALCDLVIGHAYVSGVPEL
jgi:hypothetical protein